MLSATLCFGEEIISGFDEKKDLPVLNDELRRTNENIRNKRFAAWETKTPGTVYSASIDGFVVGYNTADSIASGYTDGNSTPTTLVVQGRMGLCMPVRKNDKWIATGVTVVYWLPYKQ